VIWFLDSKEDKITEEEGYEEEVDIISNSPTSAARENILSLMDGFIEQITSIRKTLLGVSVSALILAPLAIGLSVYLIIHPSFFAILEIENEFGLVLSILLVAVLIISSIWFASGIRQYRSISSWSKRYNEYKKEKEDMDRKIALQYGLTMTDNNNKSNQ
jgi:phosphatidylserine/phosphatidylglycerophosphate/cardiolipin synthase-like enzyme